MSRRALGVLAALAVTGLTLSLSTTAGAAPSDRLKQFKVPTSGSSPEHITRTSDGNFWFTESFINAPNAPAMNVGRVTPTGAVTEFQACTDCFPTDIVQGSDGDLYFTKNDATLGHITTAGQSLPDIPGIFSPNGNGLAVHGPDIWVADFNNAALHHYNVTTKVMTDVTVPARSLDVTVDGSGTVWFTSIDGPVWRFNPSTGAATMIDVGGASREINVASNGAIWFTDRFGQRVGWIDPAHNNAVTVFTVTGGPEDIAPAADGSMWFTQTTAGTISRITPAGVIAAVSKAVKGTEPTGITVAPNGDPWFAMLAGDKIATLQLQ
jgi:virginiamycin B lyase